MYRPFFMAGAAVTSHSEMSPPANVDNHLGNIMKLAVFCPLMPVEKFVGNEHDPLTPILTISAGESQHHQDKTVHTPY